MITGTIKNKVDKIWLDIFAAGMANPLTVIEQLTYLIFIRALDEREQENESMENLLGTKQPRIFPQSELGQSMRWSRFKNQDPQRIFQIVSQLVFPAIKKMRGGKLPEIDEQGNIIDPDAGAEEAGDLTSFSRYMEDAMFLIPTPQVLQKVVSGLDDLYTNDVKNLDIQGDLYEYMLGKLSTAGRNGQFRTPKQIRDMMVNLIAPTPDDLICEKTLSTLIQTNETKKTTNRRKCPKAGIQNGILTPEILEAGCLFFISLFLCFRSRQFIIHSRQQLCQEIPVIDIVNQQHFFRAFIRKLHISIRHHSLG